MRRIVTVVLLSCLVMGTFATPASAATLSVRASARRQVVSGLSRVVVTATNSKAARVTVSIFSGSTRVRVLSPTTRSTRVPVVWNLKNSKGVRVRPGMYTYVVRARRGTSVATTRRSIRVYSSWLPLPAAASASPAARVDRFFGAYVTGAPDDMQRMADLETKIAAKATTANFFVALSEGFPTTRVAALDAHGSIPLITLEFWDYRLGVNQPGWSLDSITNGSHDERLRAFARGAKASGINVWLRPLHEMNSNWYPWGGTVNGNTPSDYAPAWRHIVDIFRAEGATNVAFLWCPNNDSVPATTANAISAYWPGDAYVDQIGLDGYNFGTGFAWSRWRTFTETFRTSYAEVTALSAKPLVICETGCSTIGGDKAAWIANMFSTIPVSFPRISGVVWFNANAECDFRVESSATSLDKVKVALPSF